MISAFALCFLAGTFLKTNAQLPAFPGAQGVGKYTTGGRGTAAVPTTVFEVTNLDDNTSPGSFRYAVTQSAAYRTIVFRISGTIHLNSPLAIKANTTIAGQTAPGDGICVADHPVSLGGDNIIVRYIRFRLGDKNQAANNGNDDAFGGLNRKNIVIDHCSISWSGDEALTIYRGDSTSVQWNIISEPLNYSYHDEGTGIQNHGYGGIWGGRHASFHHNLIAHCVGRTPRFDGSRNLSPNTPGQENVDYRNNVIYNWGSYNINGGEGGNYNIVNNYYKYGPGTSMGSSAGVLVRYETINPYQQTSSPVLPYGKYFMTGNYVDGSSVNTLYNWRGAAMNGGSLADTVQSKVNSAFPLLPVVTQSAQDAYELVLNFSGTSLPNRDTLDERIANDVRNRTGRIIDVQGGYPHATPYTQTVDAWPALQTSLPPADSDHDGMADTWETDHGLNPNDAADRSSIAANGYTNLENYLNGLAHDAIEITGTLSDFLQDIGTASAVQTYSIAGKNLTGDLVITPPAGYQLSADGGSSWTPVSDPITINQAGGSIPPTTISIRLNAAGAGTFSGSIIHSVNGSETQIRVNGMASTATAVPGGIGRDDSIVLYPNPSNGMLILKFPGTNSGAVAEIIGVDGKVLSSKTIPAGSVQTNLKTDYLPNGFYLLRFTSKRTIVTRVFVK